MNKKIVFSFLIFSLLLIGIGAASVLIQTRQEMRKKAAVDYTASLNLSRTEVELEPGGIFDDNIILNPGDQTVVAADVILNFNQNLLEITDLVPNLNAFQTFAPVQEGGSFNKDSVKVEANQTGKLEFGAVSFDWLGGATGGGVSEAVNLMTVTFKAKAPGESTISFGFDGLYDPGKPETSRDSNVVVISGEEVVDILADPSENITTVRISGEVTPTVSPSPTPTQIITPTPTPTIGPGSGNLRFQIRFQGINGAQPPTMNVRGTLKQGGIQKYQYPNIITENDGMGVFVGMFNNISPGTYTVFIKGPIYLQKNLGEVTFIADQTIEKDWTAVKLLTGDFNNDNKLNLMDIGAFLSKYTALSVPVNDINRLYDVNADGFIKLNDIGLVLSNYNALVIYGDE